MKINRTGPHKIFIILNPSGANVLTLYVWGLSYLGLTRSISWLLLSSPGHQQPWYWLCRIGTSLSYLRMDFNYLWRNDVKCKYMLLFPLKNLACKGLKGLPSVPHLNGLPHYWGYQTRGPARDMPGSRQVVPWWSTWRVSCRNQTEPGWEGYGSGVLCSGGYWHPHGSENSTEFTIGYVTPVVICGITVVVYSLQANHCHSFEDRALAGKIYRCLIF